MNIYLFRAPGRRLPETQERKKEKSQGTVSKWARRQMADQQQKRTVGGAADEQEKN